MTAPRISPSSRTFARSGASGERLVTRLTAPLCPLGSAAAGGNRERPAHTVHLHGAEGADPAYEIRLRQHTQIVQREDAPVGHTVLGSDLDLGCDSADRPCRRNARGHASSGPIAESRVSTRWGRLPVSGGSTHHTSPRLTRALRGSTRAPTIRPGIFLGRGRDPRVALDDLAVDSLALELRRPGGRSPRRSPPRGSARPDATSSSIAWTRSSDIRTVIISTYREYIG